MRRSTAAALSMCVSIVLLTGMLGVTAPGAAAAPVASSTATVSASGAVSHRSLAKQIVRLAPNSVGTTARKRSLSRLDVLSLPITAKINVTYSGFPAAARSAFQAAVDIWARAVHSSVPIDVAADWSDLTAIYGPGVLGAAGPSDFVANFSSRARQGVFYPVALANAISGIDQLPSNTCLPENVGNPGGAEIIASFNSTPGAEAPWYFGTDGNPGSGQVDLESVVLHELGHGLGLVGTFDGLDPNDGFDIQRGYYGLSGSGTEPTIFDTFLSDGSGNKLGAGTYRNNTTALGAVLRGSYGGARWSGGNGMAAYGGNRPPLYSPGTWQPGSSLSHLSESAFPAGDPNALMTPSLARGESEHDPGPIVLGMFKDMGWPTAASVPAGTNGQYHATPQYPDPLLVHQKGVRSRGLVSVPITGRFGVPASIRSVTAVLVDIELVYPTSSGMFAALPNCRPSSTDPTVGEYLTRQTRTAATVLTVNGAGRIRVTFTKGAAEVNVYLRGWYGPGGDYYHHLGGQARVASTQISAAHQLDVPIAGKGGIPSSGATSVVLKARVRSTARGWLRIGAGGQAPQVPTAAVDAQETISHLVTVPLGTGAASGKVRLRLTSGRATVVLEAVGWYGPSAVGGQVFHPASGRYAASLHGRQVVVGGLPDNSQVLLTVHLTMPTATGWLGAGPGGQNILHDVQEYRAGRPVSGTIITTTNPNGKVRFQMSAGITNYRVDYLGWFAAS